MDSNDERIELVVFDVDGTTVREDGGVNECIRKALAAVGIPSTREEVDLLARVPKAVAIRTLIAKTIGTERATEELVSEVHADYLHRVTDHYRRAARLEPMPHAEETLVRLKRAGVRIALDSAFGRVVLDAILDRLGWKTTRLIDATVASDEVGRGRPYPDMILRAMALAGVRRTEAVAKVGDTPSDLEQGASAGCGLVIGVMNGSHTAQQLRHSPHTHLISHLGVLPRLVIGHGLITAH
jgi:phosphonatase-like hydrolase